jgi:hypothetical protein
MATTKAKTSKGREPAAPHGAGRATAADRQAALTLLLDATIYRKPVLVQAAEAFAALARIEVRKEGRHQVVSFFEPDPETADRLVDEYANYALSLVARS